MHHATPPLARKLKIKHAEIVRCRQCGWGRRSEWVCCACEPLASWLTLGSATCYEREFVGDIKYFSLLSLIELWWFVLFIWWRLFDVTFKCVKRFVIMFIVICNIFLYQKVILIFPLQLFIREDKLFVIIVIINQFLKDIICWR